VRSGGTPRETPLTSTTGSPPPNCGRFTKTSLFNPLRRRLHPLQRNGQRSRGMPSLVIGSQAHNPQLAALILAGGAGALYFSQSSFWSVSADIAGRSSGVFSSMVNMGGQNRSSNHRIAYTMDRARDSVGRLPLAWPRFSLSLELFVG
jgi:hypothetical protein